MKPDVTLERVIHHSLCNGPASQVVQRTKANLYDYVEDRIFARYRTILWLLLGLCFVNVSAIILVIVYVYGRGQ